MRKAAMFGLAMGVVLGRAASLKTGPAVGEAIPTFSAIDQTGRTQTLASIAGPKGAMLVFFRSADW